MMKQRSRRRRKKPERKWAELLCEACTCLQLTWRRLVLRKWLNIATDESDYSADTDSDTDSEQEVSVSPTLQSRNARIYGVQVDADNGSIPTHRRQRSETFRAQYIISKEIKVPPDDLCVDDWLDIDDPADIYVIGLQEVIPLNAGNIFGPEDNRPIAKWESRIRESLGRIPPVTKFKCFSDPPSPSRFKPSEDAPYIEDEIELDSYTEELVNPLHDESYPLKISEDIRVKQKLPSPTKESLETTNSQHLHRVTKTIIGMENFCLSWPEPPLHLLNQPGSDKRSSLKCSMSSVTHGSLRTTENKLPYGLASLTESHLESLVQQRRQSHGYVRVVSKQMVGIFVMVWVCRNLRRHIKNLCVSTVGVGIMGYIGNKGSIAVSMSVHQTLFCFVCTHLTSGEKEEDAVKRNADVREIHRRTCFNSINDIGLPKTIYDHEKIFWLGDLNYRINLPYELATELISKKDWSKLLEQDQLKHELEKGRVFHGWYEGTPSFPPTYKYEINSEDYHQGDPTAVRRTPAWCDRILSCGTGMKLLRYRRSEHTLSDHRPVSATYMVEVDVFSHRKLQRALSFTNAEINRNEDVSLTGLIRG